MTVLQLLCVAVPAAGLLVVIGAVIANSGSALTRERFHQHPAIRDPDWVDADRIGPRPEHVAVRDPAHVRYVGV
jgi:hypothetical protein